MKKALHLLFIIILIFSGFMVGYEGVAKIMMTDVMKAEFDHFGYSYLFMIFTGIVEVMISIFLIIGIWKDRMALMGGYALLMTMIGAVLTHLLVANDPTSKSYRALAGVLLAVLIISYLVRIRKVNPLP